MTVADTTLVTGFPGFRANHLVRRLLADPVRRVVAVVPESLSASVQTMRAALGELASGRLRIVQGDPCAIDMGLSGPQYLELAKTISSIHHVSLSLDAAMGGSPGLSAAGRSSDSSNVASMRETLELASLCSSLRGLFVHSSVFVCGDREGLFLESELNVGQSFPFPGLEGLAIAEKMARSVREQLPIVVLRAAQVVGEPLAGRLTALDGLYRLILLVLLSPRELLELLPHSGDTRIHALGIDSWLRSVVAVEQSSEVFGETLHLVASQQITLRDAFHRVLDIRSQLSKESFEMPVIGRVFLKDPLLREQLQKMITRPRTFMDMAYHNVSFDSRLARKHTPEAAEIDMKALVRQVAVLARPAASPVAPLDREAAR